MQLYRGVSGWNPDLQTLLGIVSGARPEAEKAYKGSEMEVLVAMEKFNMCGFNYDDDLEIKDSYPMKNQFIVLHVIHLTPIIYR
jgi:hypothetical protein